MRQHPSAVIRSFLAAIGSLAILTAAPQIALACDDCGTSACGGCACGCGGAALAEAASAPSVAGAGYQSRNAVRLGGLSLPEMTLTGDATGILGSGIWGWADPQTGREYVLFGKRNGTAFVDITDASAPRYLGDLPTATGSSDWREIKTNGNYAYIVSDSNGSHGMQIFDLTRLRTANAAVPQSFTADARYTGIGNAHNLFVNEQSGYTYLVGMGRNNAAAPTYNGGLHILDARNPLAPTLVGGYAGDGYTHDLQVINYDGPDSRFAGREIAFASNEDSLTIIDVTDKSAPAMVARQGYPTAAYSHQGWLTEDRRFFLMNDELDELNLRGRTRTHIWEVSDLTQPVYRGAFENPNTVSIDHNMYIRDGLLYQANYTTGLRVWDISGLPAGAAPEEIAFFDTYFQDDANPEVSFNGAWGNYPFFPSGVVAVGDRQNGLHLIRVGAAVPEGGSAFLAAFGALASATLAASRRRRGRGLHQSSAPGAVQVDA